MHLCRMMGLLVFAHTAVAVCAATPEEVLERVNLYRALHGLPKVTLNAALSSACAAHASYIDQNRSADPYTEVSGAPGFTSEGKAVAPEIIFTFSHTGNAAIDFFFSTYGFRGFLLADDFTTAGYGESPGTNGGSAVAVLRVGPVHKPTRIESPKNGTKGQAATKAIQALSEAAGQKGLDIVLYGSTFTSVAEVVSTSITVAGSPVAHTVSVQTTSASNADKKGDIILTPSGPLPVGALVSIVIDYREDGVAKHKEWSFTTSSTGLFNPSEAGTGGTVGGGSSNSNTDTDGDGFPDELENALGTSASDGVSTPTGAAAQKENLTVTKASVGLNFARPLSDKISVDGLLPVPDGFNVDGVKVTADIGGVIRTFTLSSKGASPTGVPESFKLRIKAAGGIVAAQEAKFGIKLSKGDFGAALSDESFSNTSVTAQPVTLPVLVFFNGRLLRADHPLSYNAKSGKSGRAK